MLAGQWTPKLGFNFSVYGGGQAVGSSDNDRTDGWCCQSLFLFLDVSEIEYGCELKVFFLLLPSSEALGQMFVHVTLHGPSLVANA